MKASACTVCRWGNRVRAMRARSRLRGVRAGPGPIGKPLGPHITVEVTAGKNLLDPEKTTSDEQKVDQARRRVIRDLNAALGIFSVDESSFLITTSLPTSPLSQHEHHAFL